MFIFAMSKSILIITDDKVAAIYCRKISFFLISREQRLKADQFVSRYEMKLEKITYNVFLSRPAETYSQC